MISDRTRGVYSLCLLCQLFLVTAGYWAWIVAYQGRIALGGVNTEQYVFYNEFLLLGLLVGSLLIHHKHGLVSSSFVVANRTTWRQVASALFFLSLYLIALKDQTISRAFLFSFTPVFYFGLLLSNRYLPGFFGQWIFRGDRRERVVLAGPGRKAALLHGWLRHKEALGLETLGILCDEPGRPTVSGFKVLGRLSELEMVLREFAVTQVILVEFPQFAGAVTQFVEVCENLGVRLLVVSDLEKHFRHAIVSLEDEGFWFLSLREEPMENPFNRLLKRLLDLAIAVPVLLFVFPLTSVLVKVSQWLQSPGPLLYRQARAGIQKRTFQIWKYRTMHSDHAEETRQAGRHDDRVFPLGRWLRKFSVDEIPQFLNVLKGEMSVVGPRPHLLQHNELFARALKNYHVRATVKPGITGLAQIRGFRGGTGEEKDIVGRVTSDIYYLENWSFALDCWIIARTIVQVLVPPRNAY